jgi:ABC-type transporter Mla subunit MlaD
MKFLVTLAVTCGCLLTAQIIRTVQKIGTGACNALEAVTGTLETARETLETAKGVMETARDTLEAATETLGTANGTLETARETLETTSGTLETARGTLEAARSSLQSLEQAVPDARHFIVVGKNAVRHMDVVEETKSAMSRLFGGRRKKESVT